MIKKILKISTIGSLNNPIKSFIIVLDIVVSQQMKERVYINLGT